MDKLKHPFLLGVVMGAIIGVAYDFLHLYGLI